MILKLVRECFYCNYVILNVFENYYFCFWKLKWSKGKEFNLKNLMERKKRNRYLESFEINWDFFVFLVFEYFFYIFE